MTPEEVILEMNWTFDSDPGRFQLWEQLIKPAMIRFASLNRQGWTRVSEVDKARFWSKANDTGYCWEWQGSKNNDGYGHFKIHGGHITASRIAYQLINGDIPDGLQVLHKCDNPSCVNPSHLFVGTVQDNMNDMIMKGRNRALGKSSRYHGVRFRKDNGKWRSFYTINGVVTSLGCFENEVDAAKKRDAAVKELNLDLPLNFKENGMD